MNITAKNTSGIAFAFNPLIIELSEVDATTEVPAEDSNSDVSSDSDAYHQITELVKVTTVIVTEVLLNDVVIFSDERNPDTEGNVRIDVQSYLQALFTACNVQDTFETSKSGVSVHIYNKYQTTQTGTFNYTVIFGAIYPGETFNPSPSTTHWWKNFPQTFNWYRSDAAGTVKTQEDSDDYKASVLSVTESGIVNVNLADMFKAATSKCELQDIPTGGNAFTTFAMQFDGTFRPVSGTDGTQLHRFILHDETDGCFLRWLDRHGMWQYWLFGKGGTTYTDKNYGEELTMDVDFDSYSIIAQRNEGKTFAKQVSACASNVDEETFTFLSQLASSPHVSIYEDGRWLPVQISAASHQWKFDNKRLKLQDYDITIVYPSINTQKL